MAEGTYEYECMRAELLGVDKPNYDEFISKKLEQQEILDETNDIENIQELETQNETTGGISAGLDELNNILQGTQKKLNKFKASCGGITNLLKIKIGRSQNPSDAPDQSVDKDKESEIANNDPSKIDDNATPIRKSDLDRALDGNLDRLDLLNEKAERAQISMSEQSNQMKKYLNMGFLRFGGNKSD